MYLLDTNICIDYIRGRSAILRQRVRAQNGRNMGLSTITLAELRVGARRPDAEPEDASRLDLFVSLLSLHAFDVAAAETYGRIVRQIGVRRNSFDRLIGAHAVALGLTLVTRNEADFADVPGLRVENWTQ